MIFYDFEVFKCDWLMCYIDTNTKSSGVIHNDKDELESLYLKNRNEIWVGYNSRNYDANILKYILLGLNPKILNDWIIKEHKPAYEKMKGLRTVTLNNYDCYAFGRRLKELEGFMGERMKESKVNFDIDRPLRDDELAETVEYCMHDVEQTFKVFMKCYDDFKAHLDLVKIACNGNLDLRFMNYTKPRLSGLILNAIPREHKDEFDVDFPETLRLKKYANAIDWFKRVLKEKNPYTVTEGRNITLNGKFNAEGLEYQMGFGGAHGAIEQFHDKGYFINMDVTSLYPSLMIEYNLHSRNINNPQKFIDIYHDRIRYKKEKNPLATPLKLLLNSTYGIMKDEHSAMYDPRQANKVCVYGQLLLLDLIEHLEPYAKIIQANTDGILIQMPQGYDIDKWYDLIDDVAYEWESRTRLKLEFDEYVEVYQKDVNNYVIIAEDGHYKSKGAYVKELNDLDNDLPIVNRALVEFMLHKTPPRVTIAKCDSLKDFQMVVKVSGKYEGGFELDGMKVAEQVLRVFACKNGRKLTKIKIDDSGMRISEKVANTPESLFINLEDINSSKVPSNLDKQWYVNLANSRLKDFLGDKAYKDIENVL